MSYKFDGVWRRVSYIFLSIWFLLLSVSVAVIIVQLSNAYDIVVLVILLLIMSYIFYIIINEPLCAKISDESDVVIYFKNSIEHFQICDIIAIHSRFGCIEIKTIQSKFRFIAGAMEKDFYRFIANLIFNNKEIQIDYWMKVLIRLYGIQ